MKEIKLRYIFEDSNGQKHVLTETIEQIENNLDIPRNIEHGWKLISRSEYIGIKDKNNKEIYEDDRVKVKLYHISSVKDATYDWEEFDIKWDMDKARFILVDINSDTWSFDNTSEVEVIENPELVEAKE